MNHTAAWNVGLMGECMIELQGRPDGSLSTTFGGDTLNTAVYLARLGKAGVVNAEYITALGDDSFSAAMRSFWHEQGVKSTYTRQLSNRLPGLYHIEVDAQGERVFSYWRGESAAKDCFTMPGAEAVLESLGNFDALYLSGISLAILREEGREQLMQRLEAVRAAGTRLFFDGNFRPRLWSKGAEGTDPAANARPWYRRILALSHTVLLTADEAPAFAANLDPADPDLCLRIGELGPEEAVIKNGGGPCLVCHNGQPHSVPPMVLERVVDTTAAGDSFSAAYLLGRHLGLDVPEAVRRAHAMAACVVSHRGAIIPLEVMPDLFGDCFHS